MLIGMIKLWQIREDNIKVYDELQLFLRLSVTISSLSLNVNFNYEISVINLFDACVFYDSQSANSKVAGLY
jgi:hypothetical protein